MHKVAVVGDRASVLAFQAIGVDVFSPAGEDDIRNTIDRLARQEYGVIYVTEQVAQEVPKTIERYDTVPVPAIILIPNSQGSLGLGQKRISENVEKAVGVNIF